jgi:hypothetical protein
MWNPGGKDHGSQSRDGRKAREVCGSGRHAKEHGQQVQQAPGGGLQGLPHREARGATGDAGHFRLSDTPSQIPQGKIPALGGLHKGVHHEFLTGVAELHQAMPVRSMVAA